MQDITINLIAVVLLLATTDFSSPPNSRWSRPGAFGWRAWRREAAPARRLTLRIQANLESYLAACQLGITMASLGLGWVGEPAVAALLEPLFLLMGVPEAVLHTAAFVVGFLVFPPCISWSASRCRKPSPSGVPNRSRCGAPIPCTQAYLLVYPLNWLLNVVLPLDPVTVQRGGSDAC